MILLKEIDMFGEEFKLKRKRNNTFRTSNGGVISLLTLFMILAAVIYFTKIFLDRVESTTVENIERKYDQYIDFSKVPIMMRLSDSKQVSLPDWYKVWNVTFSYTVSGIDSQKQIIQKGTICP